MAWHHLVPRENALFYWPPQPRVVPCAHVIQRLLSEGKYPAGLINRKCVFLSASSQLMFHIFQWLWAESFGVLLGEPSVSVVARAGVGTELLSKIRPYCGGEAKSGDGEKRSVRTRCLASRRSRRLFANILFEQRRVPLRKRIRPGPLDSFHCPRHGNDVSHPRSSVVGITP